MKELRTRHLFLAVLVLASTPVSGVLPKPQQQTDSGDVFSLGEEFQFLAVGVHSTPMLQNAFDRYRAIIFQRRKPDGAAPALSTITGCDVNVTSDVQVKTLTTDESYELHVRAPRLFVRAATVFGALYALETFSQLVRSDLSIDGTVITDKPRFAYRGTMIDTSRHFYPVTSIKMHIDAMAYAKMNVLHWHIVDEISFPYESVVLPQMSLDGAFSPKHVYSIAAIREIVEYAMLRGVRVIPEFDTPGHVSRGWGSLGVLTQCYDIKTGAPTNFGALNPTLNQTYAVLSTLLAEVRDVFAPEAYIHVGGDEVPKGCWQSNPQIASWLHEHPSVKDFTGLETYFEQRLLALLKAQGSSYIVWQEIFDNGVEILPDTVIEVWKGSPGLSVITSHGL